MPNAKDLTGLKSHRLTALRRLRLHPSGQWLWECRCECGNLKAVTSGNLTSGRTRSCGCSRIRDLTGQVFGRLTVLAKSAKTTTGKIWWDCVCECGNTKAIRANLLTGGQTTSCGCKQAEVRRTTGGNNKVTDRTGQKFGLLTAVKEAGRNKRGATLWECVCDCGKTFVTTTGSLQSGVATSCGCDTKRKKRAAAVTHGMSHTQEYRIWRGMMNRCYLETEAAYPDYGGRGIKVCERWKESFENFLADMGPRPGKMTLDRIDANKDYEKSNCRWADRMTQSNNTRRNRVITFEGESLTVSEWARKLGLTRGALNKRLFRDHWPLEEALQPKAKKGRNKRRKRQPTTQSKKNAHQAVRDALRDGRLVKATACSHPGCSLPPSQAHHHEGYDEKNWLNVVWLCREHHQHEHCPLIELNGEIKTLKEWAKACGIGTGSLIQRLKRPSWTLEEALTTPKLKGPSKTRKGKYKKKENRSGRNYEK